ALVGLDADAGDRDAGRRALERLLVDRDGRHGARLQVNLALKADTEVERPGERHVYARLEAGTGVDLRLVGDDAAADLLTGLDRAARQLRLAAAGDLSGEGAGNQVLTRRDRSGQGRDGQLGLVGAADLEVPTVRGVEDPRRAGRNGSFG